MEYQEQWESMAVEKPSGIDATVKFMNELGNEGWHPVMDLFGTHILMKRKKDSLVPVDKDPEPGIPAVCQ